MLRNISSLYSRSISNLRNLRVCSLMLRNISSLLNPNISSPYSRSISNLRNLSICSPILPNTSSPCSRNINNPHSRSISNRNTSRQATFPCRNPTCPMP